MKRGHGLLPAEFPWGKARRFFALVPKVTDNFWEQFLVGGRTSPRGMVATVFPVKLSVQELFQGCCFLTMALRMTTSLRAQATRASFLGLPAARSR